jgi:Holliday junction resolvasome RuvABC endonuclease subunit
VEFTFADKAAITSSGMLVKQVGLMVKGLLNLSAVPKPDDAADALASALTAINFTKYLN